MKTINLDDGLRAMYATKLEAVVLSDVEGYCRRRLIATHDPQKLLGSPIKYRCELSVRNTDETDTRTDTEHEFFHEALRQYNSIAK